MTTDFKTLLRILSEAGVEFIVVGGVAAAVHGATRAQFDLDVVYRRTADAIGRLVLALTPYPHTAVPLRVFRSGGMLRPFSAVSTSR